MFSIKEGINWNYYSLSGGFTIKIEERDQTFQTLYKIIIFELNLPKIASSIQIKVSMEVPDYLHLFQILVCHFGENLQIISIIVKMMFVLYFLMVT